jgi:hypothetical protein
MSLTANPSTSKSSRDGSPFIDCFKEMFQTRPRYQISDCSKRWGDLGRQFRGFTFRRSDLASL